MKNRVMAKKLAILGLVPCLISSSLQISVHALPYSAQTLLPGEMAQKEDALESTITSVILDNLTVYCDQEGARVGRFEVRGEEDSRVTLNEDAYDNELFVIEDNILRTREKLENGVAYIIQVVYEGEVFKFKIRAISETQVLPVDPEEEHELETLPVDPEEENGLETLPVDPEEENELETLPVDPEEENELETLPVDPEEENELETLPVDPEEEHKLETLPVYPDEEHLPELLPIYPEEEGIEEKVFTTVEDVYENATIDYVLNGEERIFDGTKTIDKTMDLESIKGLTKGTIIVKARLNPDLITEKGVYSIIGFGSATAPQTKNTKAQLVGAYYDEKEIMPRYEFSNGLYSSYSKNVNYGDGQWHVMAISFDDSYIFASGDGETVLNGANGHYADEKFKGFFTRNQDMNSIQIGGLSGTDTNSNGVAYKNWIGDIAQITITDQVLTVEQANALTLAGKNDCIQVTLDGKSFEPYKIGAEVGEFILTGQGTDGKRVVLKEGVADNAHFVIEDNVLKTKEALPPQTKYTIVVTCDGETFNFDIHSEVDLNAPIIQEKTLLRFNEGMIDNGYKDYDETVIDTVKLLDSMTLKMQFSQGKSGIGSLFSFSNSKEANNHFHVYVNGSTIGYELRGAGVNYSGTANTLRFNGANTLAFKADATDYTYKIFVNGELVVQKQMTPEEYKMASDFAHIDTVSLGRTARSNGSNSYPFTGLIGEATLVPTALSDEELIAYTSQTKEVAEEKESDQPFVAGDEFGSNYFRIPALTELINGDIMAAMDVRFGSTADSPNNLDTGVRFKRNGSWEEAQLVNYFGEYTNASGSASKSASFIDPAVVQDPETGIIYMLADAWPSGGGLFGNYSRLYGNGMVKINAAGERVADNEEGTYYVGLVPNGTPIVSGVQMTHYIKPVVSTNPNLKYELIEIENNQKTAYTLNAYFELFKDGVPLEVEQKRPNNSLSGESVPMSIFYDTADFILYPVAYLWLSSSNDNGITWNEPRLIANEFKTDKMRYFIAGPGRGHVIRKGEYAGRILFPMYSDLYGERSSVIYSDDKGATWKHSDITTMTTEPGKSPGKSSEAQLVELPDGTIRMYARSAAYTNYVGYADSLDGGATFEPMRIDEGFQYASNVQLSVINYSREIDGKPAIILSAPEGEKGSNQRSKGRIHVGLVHENPGATGYDKYDIEWRYTYEVNNTAYAYSCLAELPNGDIAVLYETDGVKPYYEEIPMDRILGNVDKPMDAAIDINEQCVGGTSVDIALTTKAHVLGSLSDVNNSTLKVSFEGIDAPDTIATYKSINDEGNKLLYTVTLPESSVPYGMHIALDETTVLVTINETMDARTVKALSTEVYTTRIHTSHTITVGDINGGKVLASRDTEVYGEEVVLNIVPTEGFKYKKDSLKVNGVQVIGSAFRMPNEDVTITAEFMQDNYSVEKLDATNGTFKTSKIIAKEGDVITVSATPDRGYMLQEIKVNGSKIDGTTFKMPARDVSVEVLFKAQEAVTYDVYITQPINGSISVDQTEATIGESILVHVEPEEGYKLASLYINNEAIEGRVFEMPEKDVTISAQFIISNEVNAPSIHVSGKETDGVRTVELKTETEGASIYYTLDGSIPTKESLKYDESIVLEQTTVIKAVATKEGMDDSAIVSQEVVVGKEVYVSEPIFVVSGIDTDKYRKVELITQTPDATIYYTLDGSMPTKESLKYDESIVLEQTTVIKAVATKEGMDDSAIVSQEVVVGKEVYVSEPIFVVSGIDTDKYRKVELITQTPDATIYYTLDGSDPTQASLIYTEAIVLNKTATIKAIAVKEGMENSGVVTKEIIVGEDIKYSITFDSKGGSEVAAQEILEGQKATKPADPIREGYKFIGWYIDEGYTEAYNFDKEVVAHVTVYAKWQKNESGGSSGSGGSTNNTSNSSTQIEVVEITEDKESIIVRPQVKADKAEWQTSKKQLQSLVKDKAQLVIETSIGKVILNKEVINNLLDQVGEEVVTFTIQQLEGNKVIVGISKGREKIAINGIGTIHITIPYTLTKGQSPNNVVMYYYDSIGSSKLLKTSSYQDNSIQAQVEGLGSYEVVYREMRLKDIGDHWAKESIDFVVARDIMGGTATDTFSPEMTMTRGMFVTVLGRLANVDEVEKNTLFTDVQEDIYYAPYIAWANEMGIAQGIGEGLFGPDQEITREQLACMLVKYMQLMDIQVEIEQNNLAAFEDTDYISSWAKESMAILVEKNILGGSSGKLNPKQVAKRAEVAKMIHNIMK
ncbi:chitobiase/beta-hexosaminidase C-terminal domain-containing protein [Niameybacter massiliensis]|uniref:chitobiase/beta-hexosaminidase C-terminal domain-containing protein n=1 Tax=Niameybacter massiliensis TaxID=1658108 RepID=UPI0006B5341A|nr:chitobiase/beta-hexosaminidase C-terminal domain-containing protein [Niameybacter massiliensis]